LKEVEILLAEGRAVGAKESREYMEVRGYANAAEWTYNQGVDPERWAPGAEVISLQEVRYIHVLAMTPVWDVAPLPAGTDREGPGSFREHDIEPFPGGMTPPCWVQVAADISAWIDEINRLTPRGPTFAEDLARLHCAFEQIHPFLDGNGRTGRLVLNLVLVRLGYPPAIIFKRQRADYLRALRRADAGEPGLLGELLARAILDNLYKFVVPAIAGPAHLVLIDALQTDDLDANALRVAAVRGRLQATKGADGRWRSSRNWVDEYRANRYRRGR
jgi:cell filamentation protein, protein adenylyltransferase